MTTPPSSFNLSELFLIAVKASKVLDEAGIVLTQCFRKSSQVIAVLGAGPIGGSILDVILSIRVSIEGSAANEEITADATDINVSAPVVILASQLLRKPVAVPILARREVEFGL